jgi:zinc protease
MFSSNRALRACLTVALLAIAAASYAQDLSAVLPQDPKVIKGSFPNGLTYYIRSNKKPENKVELRLVVKAGSILETPDQLGLAHFMEHMNFNGLQHFEKNELVNYLQSIGVEFGADLNAYTSFDETVYILPIPTDKPGNLEKGFQIIEDWAHNALLTDKDINEERGVVLEESRLGKGAEDRMMKKYFPKYASGTLYADRLPIGKDEILKSFKPEVIRRYYKDWYRPDLQAVMVVGDIDSATAMKMITEHFAGLTNPASPRKRDYVTAKPRAKAEAMVVSDKEAISPSLQIIFPVQEKKQDVTLGDYKATLVRQLALSIINQRLRDLSQSAKPPFAFAGVGFDDMIRGYESFTASTTFNTEGVEKPLNALAAELLKARDFGFTQAELERSKSEMLAGVEKMYNERKTTPSQQYIEEYVRNFLTGEAMPGLENEYGYYKTLMPGITTEDVSAMPKKWMSSLNTFTLITSPQKAELKLPTDAQLLAMSQKAFTQKVAANKETAIATSLLEKLPKGGKVVSQNVEADLGATTYTLSNGVKVTIKPTDFKSDEILLNGSRKGGTNNYGVDDKSNAQYATATVGAMGFGPYTPTQIEQITSGKVASVRMAMSDIEDNINASSNVKDFETMLQLLYLRMTAPRKDEELFDAFRMKQKQQLQFLSASPQFYFLDSAFGVLYKHNPLAPSPVPKPADFDAIKLDRAMDIYKKEFGDATGYNFFLVGNVDPAKAIPLLEMYLGGLPASGKEPSYKDNGVRPITGKTKLDIHKGKEKQSLIVSVYHGELPYSEDLALKAQAVAEVLNIKVIEDLREKLGGIYTGGFQAEVAKEPYSRYSMIMYLPCGPENVDKLLSAAAAEIKTLQEKGVEQKALDKVKSQWREKYRVDIKENNFWSGKLEDILFWGRDRGHVLKYESWIDSLTPADIQQTARQLFDGKNEFLAILNPETVH